VGDGSDYRGNLSVTMYGRVCQAWTSQTPHAHFADLERFAGAGLEDGPYCRNPDGSSRPWCFTTDPYVIYEYCDICGELCKTC
jgi:hypothetical protein